MTRPDDRYARYVDWLGEYLGDDYPATVHGDRAWQVAVRFLYTLDCAALLLSDPQLDRLLQLLEYLDAEEGFSAEATSRLVELPERDFSFLVMRQIAMAVADPDASVEDMAAGWRRGFRFEAQPSLPI